MRWSSFIYNKKGTISTNNDHNSTNRHGIISPQKTLNTFYQNPCIGDASNCERRLQIKIMLTFYNDDWEYFKTICNYS